MPGTPSGTWTPTARPSSTPWTRCSGSPAASRPRWPGPAPAASSPRWWAPPWPTAVIDDRTARLAAATSRARGYLDGRALAEVFAWLRPNDLIWNYWVNNYLLGRK